MMMEGAETNELLDCLGQSVGELPSLLILTHEGGDPYFYRANILNAFTGSSTHRQVEQASTAPCPWPQTWAAAAGAAAGSAPSSRPAASPQPSVQHPASPEAGAAAGAAAEARPTSCRPPERGAGAAGPAAAATAPS